MHVESMKDFLVFSRYMNVSRAAKVLNVSQPTLSYRIAKLEKELGFDLIDHAPRPRLTIAGKSFVRYAESIVAQYDDMLEECRQAASADGGTIVFEHPVCFEQTRSEIEQLCADYSAKHHANVRFTKSHTSLLDALEDGQVDVGFIWSHPDFVEDDDSGLGYTRLPISEHPEVRFYMREENPLAAKDILRPQDIDGKKVVLPLSIRYAMFDDAATKFMKREGINLRIVHKSGTYRDIELGLDDDELAFSMEDLGDRDKLKLEKGIVSRKSIGDSWRAVPYLVYLIENDNPTLERLLDYVDARTDYDEE